MFSSPALEEVALKIIKDEVARGTFQEKKLLKTRTIDKFIAVMKEGADPVNQRLFINKILALDEPAAVARILEELKQPQTDRFVEVAIRVLNETEVDCAAELIAVARRPTGSAWKHDSRG